MAVQDTSGNTEYVAITGRTTDNLTVAPVSAAFPSGGRAQEGTPAQSFTVNLARVEIRVDGWQQAGSLREGWRHSDRPDESRRTDESPMAFSVPASQLRPHGDREHAPPRSGGNATNEITVPTDGVSRAQAGGVHIVCEDDPSNAFTVGMIMMFNGSPSNLPAAGTSVTAALTTAIRHLTCGIASSSGRAMSSRSVRTATSSFTTVRGERGHAGDQSGHALGRAISPRTRTRSTILPAMRSSTCDWVSDGYYITGGLRRPARDRRQQPQTRVPVPAFTPHTPAALADAHPHGAVSARSTRCTSRCSAGPKMTAFKLENFGGIRPRVSARLLPNNAAVTAENTKLLEGELRGYHNPHSIRIFLALVFTVGRAYRIPASVTGGCRRLDGLGIP